MNDIVRREEKIERLQRFQSLKAGAYWKATEDITEEAINAGDTLLLMSIRWVDNQAHTIILRAHPRHFDEYVIIEVEGPDGKLQKNHKRMVEHRFLVQDFLNKFEFEPNHTQIRQTEIASVHAEIHALQQVMDDAMTKPEIMKAIVDTQLAADEENEIKKLDGKIEKPLLPAVFDEVVPVVTGTVQNALSMGGEAPSMDVMKQALNREKRIAVIQTKWLENQKQQINNIIKKLMPYFNEMPAAALAMSEDVREHVDKLESGIKSMLLYTGEHVEIVPVKKGKSASSDIPLTLVQKKLIVEEELAVWADIDEWFDFRSENLFFKALNEHPELVTQIFPSERCVLVMAMTNHDVNYGEPWSNEENNKRNRRVFLMVRDGENIYQVFSPVESHLGSSRLFPARDEGEAIFRGLDGSQIKFDDVAYTDRLKGFDLRALHYKRFLILICGLDHREKLFGDFYDEPQSLDFISMRFQEDYCRFLHDEDGSGLLAAHDDRPSLNQYIKQMNGYMRSGSRMLCNWRSVMSPNTAPGACKQDTSSRYGRGWHFTADPKDNISLAIAYRKAQSICVDVPVKRRYSDSWFNCKVDLVANDDRYENEDNQLPYLCLDAIEPDDLEWYVVNRKYRGDHLFYIRFFKMAIQFIRAEREAEKPVREMMADALDKGNIGAPADRPSLISQSVIAWRAAKRGAPLTDALDDKKSWTSLLDQMYMLAGNAGNEIDDVAAFVTELGYKPLRLVVNATGKLAVYAESVQNERDDRMEKHIWVHRINIVRGKRKIRETSRTWAILPESVASETTIHQWDDATNWTGLTSSFTTYLAKQRIFERIDNCPDILKLFSGKMTREIFNSIFAEWSEAYDTLTMASNTITTPKLLIPFGYRIGADHPMFLCVCVTNPEHLLYKLAPDDASRDAIRNKYLRWYKDEFKDKYDGIFMRKLNDPIRFELYSSGDANITNGRMFNVSGNPYRMIESHVLPDRFADAMEFYQAEISNPSRSNRTTIYISPQVLSESGEVCVDTLVNNPMPDSYQPVHLVHINLNDYRRGHNKQASCRYKDSDEEICYSRWYDVCARDVPTELLVAGVISSDITVVRYPFNSTSAALDYVRRKGSFNEYKPITEVEGVPDAAMPPAGVIRMV
ncbi:MULTISPECIES: hypothetical protein [Providencia]|uniref:Uncharacterized protein n=1 Tax=Providencia rettgeri TaxID=587 RepID=A0AAW6ULK7_PRORE|nr:MULTISPECIES: hypothetical protein [Providencia]MDI9095026.1 hypothetical protein [Providencia rettgeri]